MRADRFPEEWAGFIVEAWLSEDVSRQSESKCDVCKTPKTRKEKNVYMVHWLKRKLSNVVQIINRMGRDKFPMGHEYKDGILRGEFEARQTHTASAPGL